MKILHICTFQKGGAAIAAIRLHQSLLESGHESKFLFLECKESNTFFKYKKRNYAVALLIKIIKKLQIPLSIQACKTLKYRHKFEVFSFAETRYKTLHEHPLVVKADIINLHWIANFIDYKTFFKNVSKPIVWTLHDMQPFQGGFHYKEDEIRNANTLFELNKKQYDIKKHALKAKDLYSITIVAPSKWLCELSQQSEILGGFEHKYIPYGIDVGIFKSLNKEEAKHSIGVPKDKTVILFVAEHLKNYRKGFDMVIKLVTDENVKKRCSFIAVGKIKKKEQIPEIVYLGAVSNEKKMSLIYNAADFFILPSREDNLPNTMIESLCCGTPVVGFKIGGLTESIVDFENGLLAYDLSVQELKDVLLKCIQVKNNFNKHSISTVAHQKYASEIQLKHYLKLYKGCLASKLVTNNQ